MSIECFASGAMIVFERRTPDPAGGRADREELARLAIGGAQSLLSNLARAIADAEKHQSDVDRKARAARRAEIEMLERRLAELRAADADEFRRSVVPDVRAS